MDASRSLPEAFIGKLKTFAPKERYPDILKSFSSARPTTIRTNTLKTTPESLREELESAGITVEEVPWLPGAFIIRATPLRTLTETAAFSEGRLYVQSLSSMIPARILAPQKDEWVLDLCAAPGSKTTQMAAMMENGGQIIAVDNSRIRMYRMEANLKIQGVTNARTVFSAGQGIWQLYPERFDRVLADVPCSMEGRFDTHEPKSYGFWTPAKVKELAEKQKWLLRSAVSSAKPGGSIVYSTCTLSPEENEGVIDWILKKEAGHIVLEDTNIDGLDLSPGLGEWNGKRFHPDMGKTARIWPDTLMEGFFVAKIRKTESSVPHSMIAR